VTFYEHAMIGANLALAVGLHERYGWRIVGMAAVAGALPDWDGLSLCFGAEAYARAHRVWGHNLLVASTLGLLVGCLEYRFGWGTRLSCALARRTPAATSELLKLRLEPYHRSTAGFVVWIAIALAASLSHLLADFFYSGHSTLQTWPLELLWPFSTRGWAYPIVPWGDLGATLIFVGEMFALYLRPRWAQRLAWLTLALVVLYVTLRWWLAGEIR
jgi:hypothetical protein